MYSYYVLLTKEVWKKIRVIKDNKNKWDNNYLFIVLVKLTFFRVLWKPEPTQISLSLTNMYVGVGIQPEDVGKGHAFTSQRSNYSTERVSNKPYTYCPNFSFSECNKEQFSINFWKEMINGATPLLDWLKSRIGRRFPYSIEVAISLAQWHKYLRP